MEGGGVGRTGWWGVLNAWMGSHTHTPTPLSPPTPKPNYAFYTHCKNYGYTVKNDEGCFNNEPPAVGVQDASQDTAL